MVIHRANQKGVVTISEQEGIPGPTIRERGIGEF
jgi:hypothetical protein